MLINNLKSCPARVRLAERKDAEGIRTVINCAFHPAEGFFVAGDRIDLESVLKFFDTGKFLLAESEQLLLGCVYVESRPIHEESPVPTPDVLAHKDPDVAGKLRESESETREAKLARAYLGLLAVDPSYQQSGLGTVLMNAAEDYCRGLGASLMDIKVVSLRENLLGFYRRRGYVETGTSPFPPEIETKLPCHFIEMSKLLQ